MTANPKLTPELLDEKIPESPLTAGQLMPSFKLLNFDGKFREGHDYLKKGPLIISFYRGDWCPYCNLEMQDLQNHLEQINALGATLIGITPQMPDYTIAFKEKHRINIDILTDLGSKITSKFGLEVNTNLIERTVIKLKLKGDIYASSGNKTKTLPIPGTFIIDQTGKIRFAYANPDYSKRAQASTIISELKTL